VSRRPFLALLLALLAVALAACGGDGEAEPGGAEAEPAAAVLVTRDCGSEVLLEKTDVTPGQTAMQALDRVADVETEDGGKLGTAIEGVEQDVDAQLAWLFYVNGTMADKGAAEVRLRAGDVEWWDLHDWEQECSTVPADAR
jgi:hypothetical protein